MKYTLKDMLYLMRLRGTSTNSESGNSGEGSGSGSSSGSAANVMIVNPVERRRTAKVTHDGSAADNDNYLMVTRRIVYDKTWQEVHDALAAGTPVFANIGFLMENLIEDNFMRRSSHNINDLYTRLFNDMLYAQASNNEQFAALYPIAGACVPLTAFKETDTETGSNVEYVKDYVISVLAVDRMQLDFFATDSSSDGAICCEHVIYYEDVPSDYNSELDDEYNQWLNEGNNSDSSQS